MKQSMSPSKRPCEEGVLPDEAISCPMRETASGKSAPRNDVSNILDRSNLEVKNQ